MAFIPVSLVYYSAVRVLTSTIAIVTLTITVLFSPLRPNALWPQWTGLPPAVVQVQAIHLHQYH